MFINEHITNSLKCRALFLTDYSKNVPSSNCLAFKNNSYVQKELALYGRLQ